MEKAWERDKKGRERRVGRGREGEKTRKKIRPNSELTSF